MLNVVVPAESVDSKSCELHSKVESEAGIRSGMRGTLESNGTAMMAACADDTPAVIASIDMPAAVLLLCFWCGCCSHTDSVEVCKTSASPPP